MNPFAKFVGMRDLVPVVQLDLEGKFLAEFPSYHTAHKMTNVSICSIKMCADKRNIRGGMYIFVKKAEYDAEKDYSLITRLKAREREKKIKKHLASTKK